MDIVSVITSVGFPIVACIAMGVYCKSLIDGYKNDIMEIVRKNWQEISKVTDALEKNTEAINELRQYIGGEEYEEHRRL